MQTSVKKLAPYQSPWQLLSRWPVGKPLCFLGGSGRFAMLAVDFYESAWGEFLEGSIGAGICNAARRQDKAIFPPLGSGYVGLISYDDYAASRRGGGMASPSRLWRVAAAVVFDQEAQQMFWVAGAKRQEEALWQASGGERWQLTGDELKAVVAPVGRPGRSLEEGGVEPWHLLAQASELDYLRACAQAIAEIKAGRFYQINLLRYFTLTQPCQRHHLLRRLQSLGGPQSAWFDLPDLVLASFSPERFVQLRPDSHGLQACAQPIKGTMPRFADPHADAVSRQSLADSRKDQAELHMIVDLMRNDLYRISLPRSVQVESPGEVVSFASVHHQVASLTSRLAPALLWRDFFAALCPGGSITGAPKREVMLAIDEYEQRARGYFMGQVFFRGDQGYFDSSILIRTLVGKRATAMEVPCYEYAAGSGIVSASQPEAELAEIEAKCRVLTTAVAPA